MSLLILIRYNDTLILMSLLSTILRIPDYAIPAYIAFIELGPMTPADLGAAIKSSQATTFRCIAAMRDAGLVRRQKGGAYAIIETTPIPQPPSIPINAAPVIVGHTLGSSHLATA